MGKMRKITAILDADLLRGAQAATGKNLTETLRMGLAELRHRIASQRLAVMRGKLKIDIDLKSLREDRR